MLTVTLSQLWATKRRLVGTALAVVLGIAFLAGTLVLGDTLRAGFDDLFASVNEGVDAVVRGEASIAVGSGQTATVDAALIDEVRGVDGVAAAAAEIEGSAQVIGADGEAIGGQGPPTVGLSAVDEPRFNAYDVVAGRAPRTSGEVAIDTDTAGAGGLSIGDTTTVRTPEPLEVEIVGLVELTKGGAGSGTTITVFTFDDAQRHLLGGSDQVTRILVAAVDGVSEQQLVDRLQPVLPERSEAITGTALNEELVEGIGSEFLDFFEAMLLVFAAVALLVASFSIYNTFSITVAQRTQQSALLRTVGATRRQVLASVILEAAVVGTVASGLGLAVGVGLAAGLKRLLEQFGLPIAAGIPALDGATILVAFTVGIAITVLASIAPAVRASRVAPLAALRSASVDHSDASTTRAAVGGLLTSVGVAGLALAAAGTGPVLALAGFGATATLLGVIVLGPVAARPVSAVLGAPLARVRGITGSLARDNARRNPRRTAATASALMIGIAVVTLFTVIAGSVSVSIANEVRDSFGGDLVVTAGGFSGSGLSPELSDEIDRLDEVEAAVGIGLGAALVDDEETVLTVADPARISDLLDLDVTSGSIDAMADDEIAVSTGGADEAGWRVGSPVTMTFVDGETADVTVGAVYESSAGDSVGTYLVAPQLWAPHAFQRTDRTVLIQLADGVALAAGRQAVEAVTVTHGSPQVQDRAEYAQTAAGGIDQLLGVVYVLLALAIVIALMGISNALSLSIHERTREIGLLRAVGQTRGQLRSMVRWESVLVALFGAVGGLGLGTLLAWATIRAIAASESIAAVSFAPPVGQLAVIVALGALAGVAAAVRPARRAARLDVLAAIATE